MKYLTIEEILQTHDKLIEQFGGEKGVVDKGGLDFIIDKVQSAKTDIYHKAAMLLYEIITTHPFVDGNKRTASFLAFQFADENRKQIDKELLVHHITSIAKQNITNIRNIEWRLKNCIR